MALSWPFTVDDAFIPVRYAHRLAGGLGYTFSDGPPTDGVTGPLWLLPLWAGAALGLDPLPVGKALGALAGGLAVARVIVRVRASALGRLTTWVVLGFCLTSLPLAIWSVAGLETGLSTLALTELCLGVTAVSAQAPLRAGGWAALLPWLRPELVPTGAALLAWLSLHRGRASAPAWALFGASGLSVVSFRLAMFGHVLPMSSAAKPPELTSGLQYVGAAAFRLENVLLALVLLWSFPRLGTRGRMLLGVLCVQALSVSLSGGDWMPGFRLFAPVVPVLAWVAGTGLVRLALRRRGLALGAFALVLSSRALVLGHELLAARAAGFNRMAQAPRLAKHLREMRGPVVALDIGLLSYVSDAPRFLDLGGLTEPRIAYAPGGHLDKRVDSAWLQRQAPDLLILHSAVPPRVDAEGRLRRFLGYPVEQRVLKMEWVARGYRVHEVIAYAHDYHYVLLTPRQSARTTTP